jgi:hypothetical protein
MAASVNFTKLSNTDGVSLEFDTSIINFGDTSHTIAVWVNLHAKTGTLFAAIAGASSSTTNFLPLHWQYSSDKIRVFYNNAEQILGSTALSLNTWYFLAVTFDGGSGSGTLRYYQGDKDNKVVLDGSKASLNINSSLYGFAWGQYRAGSATRYYWEGDMAYGHLYDRALSLEELQELQLNPDGIPGALAYTSLTDDNDWGSDISGNGNDATEYSGSQSLTASTDGPPVLFARGAI